MAEYRPIRPDDHAEFSRFTRYAFAAEQGPREEPDTDSLESDLFDLRGLYDDGLASGCKRYAFRAHVRDGIEAVGGLGALATPPERRREGYARELCREVCREYREEGIELVVLWPFSTPFYRRLGWATTNDFYEFALPPTTLPAHDPRGRFRRLGVEDWERLRPVEAAFADGVTLSMRRSERWWRERTLTNWTGGTEPFVYGYERNGDPAGYLVYTVTDSDSHERTLSVDAFGYVDEEAHRGLLEFLRRHGAQIDNVELLRGTDTRLLALAEDPGEVTCERVAGPMARLTTLDPLDRLDWAPLDRPLTLAVEDPLLPENERRVRATDTAVRSDSEPDRSDSEPDRSDSEPDRSDSEPDRSDSEPDRSDSEPAVRTDIGTLTQLYLGRYDPATAERVAGLTVTDDALLDPLSTVFPDRQVCLREFF